MPVFKVPQFIEVEDKLFGPLTFKQFIYLLGGAGAVFILHRILPGYAEVFLIPPVAGLALALTFLQINGRPFIITLESFIKYQMNGKLYLWKHRKESARKKKAQDIHDKAMALGRKRKKLETPALGEGKIKDLAWSLDINELLE